MSSNNIQEGDFKTVNKKQKPFQKRNGDKPKLSFKELLFELNNLKKYQHSPKVDLHEHDNSYVIRMELPGLSRNDINIQLRDNQFILVSGTKQNLTNNQDDNTIYSECHYGNFMRRVKVPSFVSRESMKSSMSNGVLLVTVDKLPHVEETVDPRLDEPSVSSPVHLEPIPEGKVIDFSSLGDFSGKSWADEE